MHIDTRRDNTHLPGGIQAMFGRIHKKLIVLVDFGDETEMLEDKCGKRIIYTFYTFEFVKIFKHMSKFILKI